MPLSSPLPAGYGVKQFYSLTLILFTVLIQSMALHLHCISLTWLTS